MNMLKYFIILFGLVALSNIAASDSLGRDRRLQHHHSKHRSPYQPFSMQSFISAHNNPATLGEMNHGSSNNVSLANIEKDLLVELFWSTNGADWVRNYGWVDILRNSSTLQPCGGDNSSEPWYGLSCIIEGNQYHISAISLKENRLVGVLPDRIFHSLSYLRTIDVSNVGSKLERLSNSLHGTLPSLCEVKNTSLENMLFEYNHFTGVIDDCIGNMTELAILQLDYNSITGSLPSSLSNMKKLKEIHLRGTMLSSSIPNNIGKCNALEVIDLSSINADGSFPAQQLIYGTLPTSLCDLRHLAKLEFQHTFFLSGSIPECFGSDQQSMVTLTLQDNLLTGSIPESVCGMGDTLNLLFLYNNSLTGSIPNCFGEYLTGLSDVELFENLLTGIIPNSFCELINMEYLYIYTASLTGTIPSCLNQNIHLMEILLDGNRLTGPVLPEPWCQLGESMHSITLYDNMLTGSIPTCISNFTQLTKLEIAWNDISGTLPPELCDVGENLELFAAFKMKLTGTIPPCYGYSFPKLETFFLQDNSLHGALPPFWKLPSLISLVLSNNKFDGTLPYSLFTQQNRSSSNHVSNEVLQSIVIEGTNIHGGIPDSVGSVKNLQTLALSGNRLSGPLPSCLVHLQKLKVLRMASNMLSGSLPRNMNNLSSLFDIDLSRNSISGKLRSEMGDMSSQLQSTKLSLNRLSCDIPSSIRHWKLSSSFKNLNLLDGNLFGCGAHDIFSLVIAKSPGLRRANQHGYESYSCGASEYIFSLLAIGCIVLPLLIILVCRSFMYNASKSKTAAVAERRLNWRHKIYYPSSLIHSIKHSESVDIKNVGLELYRFAIGFVGIAFICLFVTIPVLLVLSSSPYSCTYGSLFTMAHKEGKDIVFSGAMGGCSSCLLFMALLPWWRRWQWCGNKRANHYRNVFTNHGSPRCQHLVESPILPSDELSCKEDDPIGPLVVDVEDDCDNEVVDDFVPKVEKQQETSKIKIFMQLFLQTLFIVSAAIGPNVVYVFILLDNNLPNVYKQMGTAAITMFKVFLQNALIPYVSRLSVDQLIHLPICQYIHSTKEATEETLSMLKFHFRLNISVVLACLTTVVAPIAVVAFTDDRCLYNVLYPENEETNRVTVPYCYVSELHGRCSTFAEETVLSSYQPKFHYSGERCVSAVLDIYVPVFVASVLLAAILPATLELVLVPTLTPLLFRKTIPPHKPSFLAKNMILLLRSSSWNVNTILFLSGDISLQDVSKHQVNAARRVIERGFSQLLANVTIALTFGLAAPLVGWSCALGAIISIAHHWSVFIQIVKAYEVNHMQNENPSDDHQGGEHLMDETIGSANVTVTQCVEMSKLHIDLARCHSIPFSCAAIIVSITVAVWTFICWEYLDNQAFVLTMLSTCTFFTLIVLTVQSKMNQCFFGVRKEGNNKTELSLSESLLNDS